MEQRLRRRKDKAVRIDAAAGRYVYILPRLGADSIISGLVCENVAAHPGMIGSRFCKAGISQPAYLLPVDMGCPASFLRGATQYFA